jgi:predicted permease
MRDLLDIILYNILPLYLVVGAGFMGRRWWQFDARALSRVSLYVLSPALLVSGVVNSGLESAEFSRLLLFAALQISGMGVAGWIVARLLRLSRTEMIILVLAAMYGNAGNYGLPLNQLRYGAEGLTYAIPYFSVSGMMVYTVGVVVASLGKRSVREALTGLFRLPIFYGVIFSAAVLVWDIALPSPLLNGLTIMGSGAVPVLLLVLGIQLADARGLTNLRLATPAAALRLAVSPVLAVVVAALLGMEGIGRSASILQAATPVAVATTVITTEFDALPAVMTSSVILSTLLSPVTVALVIQLAGL